MADFLVRDDKNRTQITVYDDGNIYSFFTENKIPNHLVEDIKSDISKSLDDFKNNLQNIPQVSQKYYLENIFASIANSKNKLEPINNSLSNIGISNGALLEQRIDQGSITQQDRDIARSLNENIYENNDIRSSSINRISNKSTIDQVGGLRINERKKVKTGNIVDPYKNINSTEGLYSESLTGSDITVFAIFDFINIEDLNKPVELQRKDPVIIELDNVLSLNYSTIRDRYPVRSLGNINAKGFTQGQRTIAGHMAFTIITEDVISRLRGRLLGEISKIEANFSAFEGTKDANKDAEKRYLNWSREKYNFEKIALSQTQLLDSLPPFHLMCIGVTESGNFSKFLIKNVGIIDENQYQGIDSPSIINKVSWVATDIIPLSKLDNQQYISINSVNSITESYVKGVYNSITNLNYEITGTSILDDLMKDI